MAKRWKCARCSTKNEEGVHSCSNCRAIRGGVVVPGSFSQPVEGSVPGWPPPAEPQPTGDSSLLSEASPEAGGDSSTSAEASRPFWRRSPLQWLTIALIAIGAISGALANASRSSDGEISKGGDLTAADLRVGDCFDLKDPAADEIDEVTAVPCTKAHEYEMFFVGAMPKGSFPQEDAVDAFVETNCGGAFDAYVGTPYENSVLEVFILSPSEDAWFAGDRLIQCSAYHPRIHNMTKSLKGSGQ